MTERSDLASPLRVLGVGLVFVGILLMHGLTGHGQPVMTASVADHHATTSIGSATGAQVADVALPATTSAPQTSAPLGHDGHSGHLMLMSLCLAMLVAAVALLLLPRRQGLLLGRRSGGASLPHLMTGWRCAVPRPPDLTLLQVCRC